MNENVSLQVKELAQRLVDNERKLKSLSDEKEFLRNELFGRFSDAIQCDGGKVRFIKENLQERFTKDSVAAALKIYGVPDIDIPDIIESSNVEKIRSGYIQVSLGN